jgi:hypothetical protein
MERFDGNVNTFEHSRGAIRSFHGLWYGPARERSKWYDLTYFRQAVVALPGVGMGI